VDRKIEVDLGFLKQLRWDLIRLRDAFKQAKRAKADHLLEQKIRLLEWEIAKCTAIAWVMFIIDPRNRRRAIMPVSNEVPFKGQINGMGCHVRYLGMEGKNGGAAIQLQQGKNQWQHFDLEIDGEEQDVCGMRTRVFSNKEEAEVWI